MPAERGGERGGSAGVRYMSGASLGMLNIPARRAEYSAGGGWCQG